ncbi:uncharacterized protein LOC141658596 [Silene latifolia]|uniref:uncharacterized protein LOC141658596 n=1 Tax=Silene latifolia TaxID=37657 RepID=UPI003D77275A
MAQQQQQFQDECCYVCGVRGYQELLVCCSKCSDLAIHKYCLGIVPGSLEDKNGVHWLCDYCCEPPMNIGTSDRISDNVSTSNSAQVLENNYEIIAVQEQPEPLCIEYTDEQEEATEIMMGVVLIVSPCGEAIILDDNPSIRVDNLDYKTLVRSISTHIASTTDKIISDGVDGYKPCLAKTKMNKRKNELEKLDIVGFRRSPRMKRRKILKKCRGVSVY